MVALELGIFAAFCVALVVLGFREKRKERQAYKAQNPDHNSEARHNYARA